MNRVEWEGIYTCEPREAPATLGNMLRRYWHDWEYGESKFKATYIIYVLSLAVTIEIYFLRNLQNHHMQGGYS